MGHVQLSLAVRSNPVSSTQSNPRDRYGAHEHTRSISQLPTIYSKRDKPRLLSRLFTVPVKIEISERNTRLEARNVALPGRRACEHCSKIKLPIQPSGPRIAVSFAENRTRGPPSRSSAGRRDARGHNKYRRQISAAVERGRRCSPIGDRVNVQLLITDSR